MTNEGNLNSAGTGGSVSSVASSSLDDKLGAKSRQERPWVTRAGWEVEVLVMPHAKASWASSGTCLGRKMRWVVPVAALALPALLPVPVRAVPERW